MYKLIYTLSMHMGRDMKIWKLFATKLVCDCYISTGLAIVKNYREKDLIIEICDDL